MPGKAFIDTLIDKLALRPVVEFLRGHKVPAETTSRKGWMYVFGNTILAVFVLQIVTGIALATKYIPAPAHAYDSLRFITDEATMGAFVRGLHFFGASAMVFLVGFHMARVFLTGSYKYPRAMNWISGVFLLGLTFAMAYTGQLLRWDQDGLWTVLIGAKFAARVPLIGEWLAEFLLAGETVGGSTLSRFFAFHVLLLPALLVAFIGYHVYLVFSVGISEPPKAGEPVDPATYDARYQELKKTGKPYWPLGAWKEAVTATGVVALIAALALIVGPKGPGLPPDPTDLVADPRPDWFLIWYYALLFVKPRGLETFFMVWLPLMAFGVLLLLPIVFRRGERHPSRRPWAVMLVGLIAATLAILIVLGYRAPWVPRFDTRPLVPAELPVRTPEVVRGAALFYDTGCQLCHRALGEGGLYGPDLTDVTTRMSPEETTYRIVNGIRDMPAYRDVLSTPELEDLMAFLRAIGGER